MGQVVPFIARVRDSGDWSPSERARLEELADRLAASGVHVEVIFGATDAGDPWCVVTDGDGDVLIHVARIGGTFVIHSAVDDSVEESGDLQAALRSQMAAAEEALAPSSAVVIPFGLTARQGQGFLALVAAAAFFYETAGIGDMAEAAEPPQTPAAPDEPAGPAPETDSPDQDRQVATQAAALHAEPAAASMILTASAGPETSVPDAGIDAPAALPAPLEAPAAPEPLPEAPAAPEAEAPVLVIEGTDSDDLIVGTANAELIQGGAGDDTLAGGGGRDTLDGGAGDDRIELSAEAVAIGGAGADTFVIARPHLGGPEVLLGVVFDFSGLDGDRLTTSGGAHVRQVGPATAFGTWSPGERPMPDGPATLDGPGGFGMTSLLTSPPPTPTHWTRLDVDLNGDGAADGFVLLGNGRGGVVTSMLYDQERPGVTEQVMVIVGHDLGVTTLG